MFDRLVRPPSAPAAPSGSRPGRTWVAVAVAALAAVVFAVVPAATADAAQMDDPVHYHVAEGDVVTQLVSWSWQDTNHDGVEDLGDSVALVVRILNKGPGLADAAFTHLTDVATGQDSASGFAHCLGWNPAFDNGGGLICAPASYTPTADDFVRGSVAFDLSAQYTDLWFSDGPIWTATSRFTIPLVTITGPATATAEHGAPFSWTPTIHAASGYTVSSGALPSGLHLDAATGSITGTADGPDGDTPVTVKVTDPTGSAATTVTISVQHGAATSISVTPSTTTPDQGGTITLAVTATDGIDTWDVTPSASFTSDVTSDVIQGDTVTFPHASPHTITATVGALSASVLIQVTPTPAAVAAATPVAARTLPATGVDPAPTAATALALLGAGAALAAAGVARRVRRGR